MHLSIAPDLDTTELRDLFGIQQEDTDKILEPGFRERKIHMFSEWSEDFIEPVANSDSAYLIDGHARDKQKVDSNLPRERADLCIIWSTKTAYEIDAVGCLVEYLRSRKYSDGLVETFITVAQELLMNAIVHGNLGLDVKLNDTFDPEATLQTFRDIQEKLDDPEYGEKPIFIRLNCYSDSILFEVQDQGNGFDFEAFTEKYKETKFHKGMDLIFLLSKDIEYNRKTKMMSVILEDPDKTAPSEREINFESLRVGIYTRSQGHFSVFQAVLENEGFKQVQMLDLGGSLKDKLANFDIVICLSDFDVEELFAIIAEIRTFASHIDLPILCQKMEGMTSEQISKFSAHINDFMSEKVSMKEFVARIKAHLVMYHAKNEFLEFYNEYQKEIQQSKKTIEYLEKSHSTTLEDKKRGRFYTALILGAQTTIQKMYSMGLVQKRAVVPYSHGFHFQLKGQNYFLVMSLHDGLAPVLALSYLKGFIEQITKSNKKWGATNIAEESYYYMKTVLPREYTFKIICSRWDEEQALFEYDYKGAFLPIEYDYASKKASVYRGDKDIEQSVPDKVYKFKDDRAFFIFDADVLIDLELLADFVEKKFPQGLKLDHARQLDEKKFFNQHDVHIPYFLTLPMDVVN